MFKFVLTPSYSQNIEEVKTILNLIGTPFDDSKKNNFSNINKLYDVATKNKIGLLFLESLSEKQMINGLSKELEKEKNDNNNQRVTVERIGNILNEINCKYAIIKSIFPFKAVPNDVDVLILGNDRDYDQAVKQMGINQFEILEKAPLEICLHDSSRAPHLDPKNKDPFDVDVYKEVGASHLVYMDKRKMIDKISDITLNSTKISVFKPHIEMAISIFHSLFPERLYTLLLHLFILHTIKKMNSSEVDDFLRTCHDHRMTGVALYTLSLTESIQEICFGESPSKVTDIREGLGKKKQINIESIPYKYPFNALMQAFLVKSVERRFSYSAFRQAISMANPKMTHHIISEYGFRKNRDTY